ncbi:MAG: heme-binding domain-containing protein [Candidatus Marinimicrobia bacterium]|nr:heme-binding domain-containing protein [Candidatus Neomarinimicrobiota bacterium]MCF7830240.1 heme-binding domain-containing protein [Candidatus Neomarinimicrobiota bacterium]MCF7882267.1 heme-binding domain-containing protein [Candidatus Neomarinimicrobiota bacterium]
MAEKGLKLWGKWMGIAVIGILIIIQFFGIDRSNPPVTQEIDAPANVKNVLEKSCFDCHSNKTDWPWYSYIAPISWLVGSDVHEAREHMNFTEWDTYTTEERLELIEEIWEEVEEGEMPLGIYEIMHPDAEPTIQDKTALQEWVTSVTGETAIQSENGESEGHEDHEH